MSICIVIKAYEEDWKGPVSVAKAGYIGFDLTYRRLAPSPER